MNPPAPTSPLIECRKVTVEFGSTRALHNVTISVLPNEVLGLVGSNGAGKSTLSKVIAGAIASGDYSGAVFVNGEPARFRDMAAARSAGITLIHQDRAAVDEFTVAENVLLTGQPRNMVGAIDWKALEERAAEYLDSVGLKVNAQRRMGDLPVGQQHLVDIARGLAGGSRVFIFDESTAALGAHEVRIILQQLRQLREQGAGIVFISHRIGEVLDLCDRIAILRDGRLVSIEKAESITERDIVREMLGNAYAEMQVREHIPEPDHMETATRVLELRDWRVPRGGDGGVEVGPLDLAVGAGEVLGLFGSLGAGKTELLNSLVGESLETPEGAMSIRGVQSAPKHPAEAIKNGVALLPSDRFREGILPELSVLENFLVVNPGVTSRFGVRRHHAANVVFSEFVKIFDVRLSSYSQQMSELSGGNQQKVLLARVVALNPSLLLLDEPTKGIDVRTKIQIYDLVLKVAREGAGVIFSSMEADELLRVSSRIAVLRDGRILATVNPEDVTEEKLTQLSLGGRGVLEP